MEGNISLPALDTFQEIETMESYVNFEKHQQYLSEDRECAEYFFAGNCLGAIQIVCHRTATDFCPPAPLSHFVTVCLDPLPRLPPGLYLVFIMHRYVI